MTLKAQSGITKFKKFKKLNKTKIIFRKERHNLKLLKKIAFMIIIIKNGYKKGI